MLEVMDAGVVDWGVNFIRAGKLQRAYEALLDAYANLDVEGVREKGEELVNLLVETVTTEAVERSR